MKHASPQHRWVPHRGVIAVQSHPGGFFAAELELGRTPEGVATWITMENGHVVFGPDEEQGDVVFALRGQLVPLAGTDAAYKIAGKTLNVVKTADGEHFRLIRPS